jgi:hypothetical protein
MTLVSTVTVGSGGAASIEFTSIPQTGTDLYLVMSLRSTNSVGARNTNIKFNALTTGYSVRALSGYGSGRSSFTDASNYFGPTPGTLYTANTFTNAAVSIPNYAGSTAKSWSVDAVNENNATDADQMIIAGIQTSTAAITSLTITLQASDTIAQYSTASLYTISTDGATGATVS